MYSIVTKRMPVSFADSNIVLYALSPGPKSERAWEVLMDDTAISVQVLNEVANVSRRKRRMPWNDIREDLMDLRQALPVVPVTIEIHQTGLDIAERYGLSTYDSMIAAAALEAGCRTLWSEDMHNGLILDGSLTIRNPFKAT
jgi:predicted nucleic acid-binding protein